MLEKLSGLPKVTLKEWWTKNTTACSIASWTIDNPIPEPLPLPWKLDVVATILEYIIFFFFFFAKWASISKTRVSASSWLSLSHVPILSLQWKQEKQLWETFNTSNERPGRFRIIDNQIMQISTLTTEKITTLVLQLYQPHFQCSIDTHGYWLPYWTVKI